MNNEVKAVYPRWQIGVLAAAILTLLISGAWFFNSQYEHQREVVEAHLRSIAILKARQIGDWRSKRVADAAVLMERLHLVSSVERFLSTGDPHESSEILRRLRTVKDLYHYADILLVDLSAKPRLSLHPKIIHKHEVGTSYITAAISRREPLWTPVAMESDYTAPHLSVIAPLFSNRDGQRPIGALIMICDAARYLYPFIQSWPTPSKTAETLLVRKSGDEVLFLNELRHTKDTALKLRISLNRSDLPAAMAVAGKEGFFMGRDYRGVEVVSVIMPIRESPWYMIAKVDKSEAFAVWRIRSMMILMLIFGGMGLVLVIGLVLRQRFLKSWYRERYQSEAALSKTMERQSIALNSIGDGVIATDSKGRVELMNPVAERLTGWRLETASGTNISEVFHVICEDGLDEIENPVHRVLKEGIIQGLGHNVMLVARDGRKIPITDSSAPIKDGNGRTIGVVLVFKDQTKEREHRNAIEERERKFRLLSDNSLDAIWTMNMDLEFTYINQVVEMIMGYTAEEWIGSKLSDHCDEESFSIMAEHIAEEMAKGGGGRGVVFEAVMLKKNGDPVPVEVWGKIIYDGNGEPTGFQGTTRDISERKHAEKTQQELQEQLHQAQKIESVGRLAGGVAHDYNNILSVIIGYTELCLDDVDPEGRTSENLQEVLKAAFRSRDVTRQLLAFARKETITPEVLNLNTTLESMLKMIRRLIGENIELVWLPGKALWPVKMDPSQIDQILANLCVNARDAILDLGTISIETGKITIDETYCDRHQGFIPGEFVTLSVSDDGSGMEKETLDKIFEPFFTTKEVGAGTGLGLSTVYGIVKQNSGFINVYSEIGRGTTIRIYLPRCTGFIEKDQVQTKEQAPKGRGETVLVVEDEASILRLTDIILRRLGYNVFPANSPGEALKIAKRHDEDISLLITDVVMPEMNGKELTEQLQAIFPKMKYLFMSGYTADVIARSGVLEPGVHFIQKPFSQKDLAVKIREVLDS